LFESAPEEDHKQAEDIDHENPVAKGRRDSFHDPPSHHACNAASAAERNGVVQFHGAQTGKYPWNDYQHETQNEHDLRRRTGNGRDDGRRSLSFLLGQEMSFTRLFYRALGRCVARSGCGNRSNPALAEQIDDQAENHSYSGGGESGVKSPSGVYAQPRTGEWGDEGAQVDAHVKDGECTVASRVIGRIEPPDLRGHVGFEQPVADDQQTQRNKEHLLIVDSHAELADRHRARAQHDRPLVPQIPIREEAAQKRREIDKGREPLVDAGGSLLGPLKVIHHVEDEEGAHPIVVESFPHLREEENEQSLGMPQNRAR
jgi:hypothetical protein